TRTYSVAPPPSRRTLADRSWAPPRTMTEKGPLARALFTLAFLYFSGMILLLAGWPRLFASPNPTIQGAPRLLPVRSGHDGGGAVAGPAHRITRRGTQMTDENTRSKARKGGGKPETQLMPPPKDVDDDRREVLKDLIRQ